ncbi:hypothetical protein GCM10009730_50870 [Streptomyces albidochromogenes]
MREFRGCSRRRIHATLPGKTTRAAVRRVWNEIVGALADEDDYSAGDEPLPTGLDKPVASLVPEPIYIPGCEGAQ